LGEELAAQVKTDVSTRAITNMDKYRPTVVVERDGKKIEEQVGDNELNIGKQLIERAVQTGDFETVRNRAKALGVSSDWFDNALYQTQMDLSRKEASLEAQTGKKASQHFTAGTTMINEKTGQMVQLSTLNGQARVIDGKTGRVLMGDAQPKLTADNGWYKVDKTPGAAGSIVGAEESAKLTAKTTEEADKSITKAAVRAATNIETNDQIRSLLNQGGEVTGMLSNVNDPITKAILTAASEGFKVTNGSISLPVEATLQALNITNPADKARLDTLKKLFANKVFGAVQSADFSGPLSDKDLNQIQEGVPTAKNSKQAIEGMLILDDFAAKKDQRIAEAWGAYKSKMSGINVNYNQWARENQDIARNYTVNGVKQPDLVEEYNKKLKTALSGNAPSAPGSKPSGSTSADPKQAARDAESKRYIEAELKAAQDRLANAKTPEDKSRAERDVESAQREVARINKSTGGSKLPAPVQPSAPASSGQWKVVEVK
jgi:hypothetical protein